MSSMSEIFVKSDIVFDDKKIDASLIPVDGSIFGILNLLAGIAEHNSLTHELTFMVDRSASMMDECGDGKTKMQHICHILKNMVGYFKEHTEFNVNITISTFDDRCNTVIERTPINTTNFKQILEIIDDIRPRGSTNIEHAINHMNQCCSLIRSQFPTHNVCNVFMTDGQATAGNHSEEFLYGLIDRTIDNTFIGVGLDHDGTLLSRLGSGKNANYYFVDKLENSGFVYGEIIHGIIYKILSSVHISIENGLVYDYKNNTWVTTLEIGNVVGESNKTYHIATHNHEECSVIISGVDLDGVSLEHVTVNYVKENGFSDLEKYMYRQRTLQHLYVIREFIKKKDTLTKSDVFELLRSVKRDDPIITEQQRITTLLVEFMTEIKAFMNTKGLLTDPFMKILCDDIYICYRTFTTQHASMYASARQASQGSQRSYTATHTPDREISLRNPLPLTRQNKAIYTLLDHQEPDDAGILHIITDFDDIRSPYSTQTSVNIMRAISGNNAQPMNGFDLEDSPDV